MTKKNTHPSAVRHESIRRRAWPADSCTNPLIDPSRKNGTKQRDPVWPDGVLRLEPDTALEFRQDLDDAIAIGVKPTVLIEGTTGLSREYLNRILHREGPTYVSSKAYIELAGEITKPKRSAWATIRLTFLLVLAALIGALAAAGTLLAG